MGRSEPVVPVLIAVLLAGCSSGGFGARPEIRTGPGEGPQVSGTRDLITIGFQLRDQDLTAAYQITWDSWADRVGTEPGGVTATLRLSPFDRDGEGEPVEVTTGVGNHFPCLEVQETDVGFLHDVRAHGVASRGAGSG